MINKRNILFLILILLFLGMIYAPPKTISVKTYAGKPSPDNGDPLGSSNYVELLKFIGYKVSLGNPTQLDDYSLGDVYILLGPDKPLTDDELLHIKEFLNRGGSILIADEFGTVNNLLNELFDAQINPNYAKQYYYSLKKVFVDAINPVTLLASRYAQGALIPLYNSSLEFNVIGNNTPTSETKKFYYETINLFTKPQERRDIIFFNPSISSYIGKLGILTPMGYILTIDHENLIQYLDTGLDTYINKKSIYVYSARYQHKLFRAYVIADTSIFTNQLISKNNIDSSIFKFHVSMITWLSHGERGRVLIDNTHYIPFIVKQPIPRLGRLILDLVINTSNAFINNYNNYLTTLTPAGLFIIFLITIPSTYAYLKKKIKVKDIGEIDPEEVMERWFVYKSEVAMEIERGRFIKSRYRELFNGLYSLLNFILNNILHKSISEIAAGKEVDNILLKKYDIDLEKLKKLCERMERIRLKISGVKRFPIILSWGREIKRLIKESDEIFRKLGYGFISTDVESGVEDVYR